MCTVIVAIIKKCFDNTKTQLLLNHLPIFHQKKDTILYKNIPSSLCSNQIKAKSVVQSADTV